ncbi:hypothetical protein GCM10022261_15420 [Brevibacterium daeguense]|uniref:Uncharacterized protein n=1 Tax=Brevibacterium daeguense TaxID=909936 RepID=A0ABP8EJC9_9MICO|nr:hypothetical protein [Brevibacterium daeguense]
MTGSRFFSVAAGLSFLALFLVLFGAFGFIFVEIAFFVQAVALLSVLTGAGIVSSERVSRCGKPGSIYLA